MRKVNSLNHGVERNKEHGEEEEESTAAIKGQSPERKEEEATEEEGMQRRRRRVYKVQLTCTSGGSANYAAAQSALAPQVHRTCATFAATLHAAAAGAVFKLPAALSFSIFEECFFRSTRTRLI